MAGPHSGKSAGGHSRAADTQSISQFCARLDAAGKGVDQHRAAKALQTAALRDNRTRRNPQAEQSNYTYLCAQERYLANINWYGRQLEERERLEGIRRAA